MAWEPIEQTPNLVAFVDNLLGFIQTNQTDALVWANDNQAGLRDFSTIHNSALGRVSIDFPALVVSQQRARASYGDDLTQSQIALAFEGAVDGNDADEIQAKAMKYARAVESMILNCPQDSITENTNLVLVVLDSFDTDFEVLRNNSRNEFLQIFTITATFTGSFSSY